MLEKTEHNPPENVTIDSAAQTQVERAHLAEVDCIAMAEEYNEFRLLNRLDVHTGDSIIFGRARPADLDFGQIARRVLPFGSGGQVQFGLNVVLVAVWRRCGGHIVAGRCVVRGRC